MKKIIICLFIIFNCILLNARALSKNQEIGITLGSSVYVNNSNSNTIVNIAPDIWYGFNKNIGCGIVFPFSYNNIDSESISISPYFQYSIGTDIFKVRFRCCIDILSDSIGNNNSSSEPTIIYNKLTNTYKISNSSANFMVGCTIPVLIEYKLCRTFSLFGQFNLLKVINDTVSIFDNTIALGFNFYL